MSEPRRRPTHAAWWLIAGAWGVASAGLGVWLATTPDTALRDQLRRAQFWMLEGQFLLLALLTAINVRPLVRSLAFARRDFFAPVAASILAFSLATWVAPATSRIYFDEQIYQNIGQNLADLRLAQMCNDGNAEYGRLQCWRGEYNKEPYGYPYLLSLAYRVAGVNDRVAHRMNALAPAALAWVVFLTAALVTGRWGPAAFAALVAALIPDGLRWSHAASAEPFAALACAFAVMTALAFIRLRSTASLLWATAATAFAIQFRPECGLIALVVGVVVLLHAPDEFGRPRLWWAGLAGLALSSLHLAHMFAVRNEGWGATGSRISLEFFRHNLSTNGWFYLGDPRFPVVFTALALLALATRAGWRSLAVPVVHFFALWSIFLVFYAGSYDYGADDRFSLMSYPPLAVLAGIGAWRLTGLAGRLTWLSPIGPRRAVAAALVLQALWYLPFVRAVGEEAWAARADVAYAKRATIALPPNAFVLTHNPSMFHVWGQSAAQASIAANEPAYVQTVLVPRYAGGVFFHWNFWCNVADPAQQAFCHAVLDRFPHTLVSEYRERDYRYAIYRLDAALTPRSEP